MNFPLPTFSGIDPSYSLPNNVAVITLQVSKKKFLLKISPNKLFVMPLEDKRMHSLHCFLRTLSWVLKKHETVHIDLISTYKCVRNKDFLPFFIGT